MWSQTKTAFLSNLKPSKESSLLRPVVWLFLGLWAVIYVTLAITRGIPYPTYELVSFMAFMGGAGLITRLETRVRRSRRRT